MRWDTALQAIIAALQADTDLMTELGDPAAIREETTSPPPVPALTYLITDGEERENTETMLMRWDPWGADRDQAIRIERRLRTVLVDDTPIAVNGVIIWSWVEAARDVADDDATSFHRSIEIEHEFVREA